MTISPYRTVQIKVFGPDGSSRGYKPRVEILRLAGGFLAGLEVFQIWESTGLRIS